MVPLKRLLNVDGNQTSGAAFYDTERSQREQPYGNSPEGDVLSLGDKSWDNLWSELLSVDLEIPGQQQPSSLESPDETGVSFNNVEGDIELWAAHSLQQSHDLSPHVHQPTPNGTSASDFESGDNEIICYGMIYRTTIKVKGDMLEVDSKLKASNKSLASEYYTFKVENSPTDSGTEVVLKFQDNMDFGHLNVHASKALKGLIGRPSFQIDAIGSIQTFCESIGRATKQADATVRVDMNIYGLKRDAEYIGQHLSSHKVFLQRPDRQRPGTNYDNPHLLRCPEIQLSSADFQMSMASQRLASSQSSGSFEKTISDVYASLKRGTNLSKVEGDRRLVTQLLPHQQQALSFMIQRENGPVPTEFRLWKPVNGDNHWFQHAVTKAKTRTPSSEIGGGILADEMGMGKSLSILALVTHTLDGADDWVQQQMKDTAEDDRAKHKPSRTTLIVVPSAILINEWLNEIRIHLDGTLRTFKYHGSQRKTLQSELEGTDIVLTTYHTLVADLDDKSGPLHKINWFRVVLDEAHIIRRQATTFYRAVSDLKARSRWCLTGTPIQNRLEDIGALFAFIQARPFHSIAMFRRFVTIPFNESEERRSIATRNLTLLLESLCLRRSRELLHLPDPENRTRKIEFSQEERGQYDRTMKTMNRTLRQRAGESHSKNIFGMFQIQLQLRILCNHGTYQHPFSWQRRSLLDEREAALCSIGDNSQVNCSACRQSMPMLGSNNVYRPYAQNCAHILCSDCLEENEIDEEITGCPLCVISGVPITSAGPRPWASDRSESYLRQEGHSSKMTALITDIRQDLWATKSIVFSCWTNTLNLIERYLRKENIPFQRIDGDCPLGRRQRILNDFSLQTSKTPVLIMTTGTGAYGLNLTAANRVFIIEPQWNPSVENQAISRAIRMRQKESVLVTRYIVERTVEQEMRSQQERKLRIAEIGNNPLSQEGKS